MHVNGTERNAPQSPRSCFDLYSVLHSVFSALPVAVHRQRPRRQPSGVCGPYSITHHRDETSISLTAEAEDAGTVPNEDRTGFSPPMRGTPLVQTPVVRGVSTFLAYDKHIFAVAVSRLDGQTVGPAASDGGRIGLLSRFSSKRENSSSQGDERDVGLFRKLINVNNLRNRLAWSGGPSSLPRWST
jgi:hypothetical protein